MINKDLEKMEKIGELKSKGFKTGFFVLPEFKEFLEKNKVENNEFLPDSYHWYEVYLFEQIDGNNLGKDFKVVYYGIIEKSNKHLNQSEEGFEEEFEYDEGKVVGDWIQVVSETPNHKSFAIKYKVLEN